MPDAPDISGLPEEGLSGESFQPVADLSRAFWRSRILITAVDLDLFTTLGGQSLTSMQLAARLDADPRGVELLAKALVALGFLGFDADRYTSTELSRRFLDGTSTEYRGRVVRLAGHWWDQWSQLTTIVRDGAEAVVPLGTEACEDFTLAMHQGKPEAGEILASKLDLHGVRRIVDLGGGPGTFSESLAEAVPEAQIVLVDRPEVLEIAERRLPDHLLHGRVILAPRDFMTDGIPLEGERPGAYDLALVSSVLHLQGPRDNRSLLGRVYDALEPGGRVAIREFLVDETGTAPVESVLFAVAMLVGTSAGRCYSFAEIRDWLHEAGFGEVEQESFAGPVSLITARRA